MKRHFIVRALLDVRILYKEEKAWNHSRKNLIIVGVLNQILNISIPISVPLMIKIDPQINYLSNRIHIIIKVRTKITIKTIKLK